ncbi:MAG TPA: HNH endonuclease [Phycisphaerae bacterium]|nr:HNH endonuclease [Phycisphaerae bacterium]
MPARGRRQRYGAPWTRDELILAFDLYCRIPFKKTKANNPEVIELAGLLKRSPASVARKLGNFGSFDPELHKRQVVGLTHASKLDRAVWDEFHGGWNELVVQARRLREQHRLQGQTDEALEEDLIFPQGVSEKDVLRKTRIHQSFFREAVLASYEDTCCVTGLRIRECLIASHIVPWSVAEQHRTDPRNGLCLSATFDRLFERGLLTITPDLVVSVSPRLRESPDQTTSKMVCVFHDRPIVRPRRFLPLDDHLAWHREKVFQD